MDWTQEQEPTGGRFRRTAQVLQPSPPGQGLLSLLSPAQRLEHSMEHPSLPALLLQLVCKFIKRIREEGNSAVGTGVRAYPHIFKTKTSAALLGMLVEEGLPSPKQVSSLWPGFDPPSNCLASQATAACWSL